MPVIRISQRLYDHLSKHAKGFDTPENVIERLLGQAEGIEPTGTQESESQPESAEVNKRGRLFNNQEIQQRISAAARNLPDDELNTLCDKAASKELLNINFPLFIRVPMNSNTKVKRDVVKDHNDVNRWSWKHGFEHSGYDYAICTQWYDWNDQHVKAWLQKHEAGQ